MRQFPRACSIAIKAAGVSCVIARLCAHILPQQHQYRPILECEEAYEGMEEGIDEVDLKPAGSPT